MAKATATQAIPNLTFASEVAANVRRLLRSSGINTRPARNARGVVVWASSTTRCIPAGSTFRFGGRRRTVNFAGCGGTTAEASAEFRKADGILRKAGYPAFNGSIRCCCR